MSKRVTFRLVAFKAWLVEELVRLALAKATKQELIDIIECAITGGHGLSRPLVR
jgi:hypothetical protein